MSLSFGSRKLINVYISIVLLISAFIIPKYFTYQYVKESILILAYLVAGFSVIKKCITSVKYRNFFDENFLMTIASLGAICLGDYVEAVVVMILYGIGEYFENQAIVKSEKSIQDIINIRPLYANVIRNGKTEKVNPDEVLIGEIIIVKAGERIPLDGYVEDGKVSIDVSSLTGETIPREVKQGDYVYSGCINLNGVLKIKTDKNYEDCAVNRLMDMVESSRKNKSKTEKFITKFAKIYTPVVLILSLMLVLFPFLINIVKRLIVQPDLNGLINGFMKTLPIAPMYIKRAITFLVISCPCAFVISIPLTFFAGIGVASKFGILVKGGNYLEALANTGAAVFDKTGTLTKGQLKVTKILPASDVTNEELAQTVLKVESGSNHPVALAIKKAFNSENNQTLSSQVITEISGKGLWYSCNGTEILVGNKELMKEYNIVFFDNNQNGTKVFVAKNKKYLGCIILADEVKQSSKIVISQLRRMGIKSIMLTGDIKDNAKVIANAIGIDEFYSSLLPEDKVHKMEMLVKSNKGKSVIYLGDGINDAPVLARADVGIAMGAIGSEFAIESADVVITDDNLAKTYFLLNLAKRTMKTAKQNIWIAIGVKLLFLLLGAFGFMTMWLAIFADTGVTLIAILNALKLLKFRHVK